MVFVVFVERRDGAVEDENLVEDEYAMGVEAVVNVDVSRRLQHI